jgi:hypothetical protein
VALLCEKCSERNEEALRRIIPDRLPNLSRIASEDFETEPILVFS